MYAHHLDLSGTSFLISTSTLLALARVYACTTFIKNNNTCIPTHLACVCVHGTHCVSPALLFAIVRINSNCSAVNSDWAHPHAKATDMDMSL